MYTTSIEMLLHDCLLTQIYLFNKIKNDTYESVKPKLLKEILLKRLIKKTIKKLGIFSLQKIFFRYLH